MEGERKTISVIVLLLLILYSIVPTLAADSTGSSPSIFDKIIGFNKESDSDGTSTFQANIVMKEAAYISTGELISFYKDVGSLKRIYTGVIDNVASTEKAGIYTYQVSGKEDENNPI